MNETMRRGFVVDTARRRKGRHHDPDGRTNPVAGNWSSVLAAC
jgi:hypothetical protein